MTRKNVEFHEAASLELEAALEWYLERSEPVAFRFAEEFSRAISEISESPQRWPVGIYGTRRSLLRRFPFAVVYRELPHVVQVLAVAHGHRKPGYWKKQI